MRKWIRPVFVGYIRHGERSDDNSTDFVGKKATVIRSIDPVAGGKVEFNGTSWSAEADQAIPEGTIVEIIGKDNLTLKVQTYSV
jgi:membrane protein implicated in regulation of membrane protease activity